MTPFSTVVIGSPIYGGAVRDEIISFCELHEIELIEKRVAVFTVGVLPVYDRVGGQAEHEGAIERVQLRAPGVNPVSHGIFTGAYDPEKVNFVSRVLMQRRYAPAGDFRDPRAIQVWVDDLAQQIAA